jgi:hypothetical protein
MEKINWLLVIEGKGSLVGVEEVKEDKYQRGTVRIYMVLDAGQN